MQRYIESVHITSLGMGKESPQDAIEDIRAFTSTLIKCKHPGLNDEAIQLATNHIVEIAGAELLARKTSPITPFTMELLRVKQFIVKSMDMLLNTIETYEMFKADVKVTSTPDNSPEKSTPKNQDIPLYCRPISGKYALARLYLSGSQRYISFDDSKEEFFTVSMNGGTQDVDEEDFDPDSLMINNVLVNLDSSIGSSCSNSEEDLDNEDSSHNRKLQMEVTPKRPTNLLQVVKILYSHDQFQREKEEEEEFERANRISTITAKIDELSDRINVMKMNMLNSSKFI